MSKTMNYKHPIRVKSSFAKSSYKLQVWYCILSEWTDSSAVWKKTLYSLNFVLSDKSDKE